MSSLKRHEGYIMVDHRASPGLPDDIARQAGFDPQLCGEGKLFESAILSCSHCRTAFVKNLDRTRERGYCAKCDHYVCDLCHAEMQLPTYTHLPFDKFVDLSMRFAEQGVILGSPRELLNPLEPVAATPGPQSATESPLIIVSK